MNEYLTEYGSFAQADAIDHYNNIQADDRCNDKLPASWNDLTPTEQSIFIDQMGLRLQEQIDDEINNLVTHFVWELLDLSELTQDAMTALVELRDKKE